MLVDKVLSKAYEPNETEKDALRAIEQIAESLDSEEESILETLWKMRMIGKHADRFSNNTLE